MIPVKLCVFAGFIIHMSSTRFYNPITSARTFPLDGMRRIHWTVSPEYAFEISEI